MTLDKELLTVKEVAKALEFSKMAIYEMISRGKLKAINLGIRMIRILRSDILLMLGQPEFIVAPKIKEKKPRFNASRNPITFKDGYKINEIIPAFVKSRNALYIYLKRNKIPGKK